MSDNTDLETFYKLLSDKDEELETFKKQMTKNILEWPNVSVHEKQDFIDYCGLPKGRETVTMFVEVIVDYGYTEDEMYHWVKKALGHGFFHDVGIYHLQVGDVHVP